MNKDDMTTSVVTIYELCSQDYLALLYSRKYI